MSTLTMTELQANLERFRAQYPATITPDQAGEILVQSIDRATNWFLHKVGSANNGWFYGSQKCSCDIVSDGIYAYDVFRNGPDSNASDPVTGQPPFKGEAQVTWQVKGAIPGPGVLQSTVDGPPVVPPGPTPGPTPPGPPPQPYPDEGTWWPQVFDPIISFDYQRAGKTYPDGKAAFRWASRTAYDIGALGLTKEDSLAKHREEWCAALGVPVIVVPVQLQLPEA